ncbi:MAG: hypothetical protein COB02_09085 [Candidatus Cloacimonadota bacterium]|nr:MAG: hypothetical protein COB02_09085 [Candidatus Cloacimonadota bacterium]
MKFDHLFIEPSNFKNTKSFLMNTLKLNEDHSWGDDSQGLGGHYSNEHMKVVIADHHDTNDSAKTHGKRNHAPTIHMAVDDVDKFIHELEDKTCIVLQPEDTHWGTRWAILRDPDNNLYAFESVK